MTARRGRPPKLEENEKESLVIKFEKYIEHTEIPIIAEFAAQNGLWKQYFYDHGEFTNLIKKCTTKKEAALEKGALENRINPTMAIFSLKQQGIGWRDKEAKIIFVDPKTLSELELKRLVDDGS